MIEPITVPIPPETAAPPMKTEAIASSSQPLPSCGPEAVRAGDEDHAGERGEHRHVHHDEEVDPAVLHTREARGLAVATDGVDVTAEHGVAGDERVDDDEQRAG